MTELLVPVDSTPGADRNPDAAPRVSAPAPHPRASLLTLGLDLTAVGSSPAHWSATGEEVRTEIDQKRVLDLALLAERGVLDFVAFDDEFALSHTPTRTAASRLDAARMACRLATSTSGIGLVATLDTSYLDPVHVATAIATLHEKSGGRAAWQVGTSQARLLGHTAEVWARLDREIRTVVGARGKAVGGGVVGPGEPATAPRAAPRVVIRADSPLAIPVAGAYADVVRINALDADHARSLRTDVRAAATAAGREPDDVRVLVDVVAIVSQDAAAARARRDLLGDLHAGEPAWSRTLSHLGNAAQFADLLDAWVTDEIVDGFTVLPGSFPHDVRALVLDTVPALQERGLVPAAY